MYDYHAPAESVALLDAIQDAVPSTRPVIGSERQFHEEPLPHLEMAAVARWFLDDFRLAGGRLTDESGRLVRLLESEFEGGVVRVDEVIALSFLAMLQGEPDHLTIRRSLPPKLAAHYARWYDYDDEGAYRRVAVWSAAMLGMLGLVLLSVSAWLALTGSPAFIPVGFFGLVAVTAAVARWSGPGRRGVSN